MCKKPGSTQTWVHALRRAPQQSSGVRAIGACPEHRHEPTARLPIAAGFARDAERFAPLTTRSATAARTSFSVSLDPGDGYTEGSTIVRLCVQSVVSAREGNCVVHVLSLEAQRCANNAGKLAL